MQPKCATQQVLHSIPIAGHPKKSTSQQRVTTVKRVLILIAYVYKNSHRMVAVFYKS